MGLNLRHHISVELVVGALRIVLGDMAVVAGGRLIRVGYDRAE